MNGHLPDLTSLHIHDPGPPPVVVPDDILHATGPEMQRLKTYAKSLPYSIEPNSKMQGLLDFFLMRMVQALKAKDFDPGFLQWDGMMSYWVSLKYPIPKEKRIALIKLYYEVAVMPGLPNNVLVAAADAINDLSRSKNKLSIDDIRMPWKPLYTMLSEELFLSRRKFEINQVPSWVGYIADSVRRFFHPAAIDEMLETFLPLIDGTDLNTVLSAEYYLLTFLPLSHPQSYLPMLFRLWESINSYMFDERMLYFLAQLAEMHVDPTVSDPRRVEELPDDARSEGEGRPNWKKDDLNHSGPWMGLAKDVGIFTEDQWNLIMWKCLASMEIPLADTGSLTTGPSVDNQASFEIGRLRKSTWRIFSLARLIVYSMTSDGPPLPPSGMSTPWASASGFTTPEGTKNLGDYLSAPLGIRSRSKVHTYLAGCKALDSLARMIVSTESFFHPTNSGSWTADLSAFIKYVVYEFNKRWYEEQQPDCKTPLSRRLTREMRRELVTCLRTVTLLAMFSRDSTTVTNIQSCLKSMTIMEPDLILHPVLERAVPSLEALVETQRTMAVIKALGAVALALVSRNTYYPGAKHLVPILQLLIPGIDLNDPAKTLCTTAFLVEISQYIKFGDLTSVDVEEPGSATDIETRSQSAEVGPRYDEQLPMSLDVDVLHGDDMQHHSRKEEDAILKQSTSGFADWIASFIRRVILLLENLPEEGADGTPRGGETEAQVVDSVTGACSQICIHLSDPLFDLVLNMIYDYASTNVRANAVRAVHQLVECVANANAAKTLQKFMPFCTRNILTEIDHGASSVRTTSTKSPIPSDTTLHWNLAILRGAMHNDGQAIAKYRAELIKLFRVLRDKAFSKRGYSWTGKLLSSVLLSITHTYPLENRFVNPDEWNSKDFRRNHHRYWGKLYAPEDVKMSWHVPSDKEIDFAFALFREIVEPAVSSLENLLEAKDDKRDNIWRNDFCRFLTLVRNAFSGTPTLVKEVITPNDLKDNWQSSDIIDEIWEMNGTIEPLKSCFVIDSPSDPRHRYYMSLKRRFGDVLRAASSKLRQQGDENMIDPVLMLIRSIRTFMIDYGDSRDSYYSQSDQYATEISLAQQYAKQKVWPRAVLVRRARRYHSARLRWNSIERIHKKLEDDLVDELVEWSMWNYATVRETAQSLLETLCSVYDGVRRRCVPKLYACLAPGSEEDRVKGALWTLNLSVFTKYAMSAPDFRTPFLKELFSCQPHSKPSIQDCVASLSENSLACLSEPMTLVYSVNDASLEQSLNRMLRLLPSHLIDDEIVHRCTEQRVRRVQKHDEGIKSTVDTVLEVAESSGTHWKYSIVAIRILRSLIRRDQPFSAPLAKYFLEKTYDTHYSIRYYAQRAVMKSMRYVKLRTFHKSPEDLAFDRNHNPLRVRMQLSSFPDAFNGRHLLRFKERLEWDKAGKEATLQDKLSTGWLAWPAHVELFLAPPRSKSCFKPWEAPSQAGIQAVRDVVLNARFWKALSIHYAEENHNEVTTADNIALVKSIFQLLEEEPFEFVKPVVESLIDDVDQNKQRAAAEILAGILGGMKHWPVDSQQRIWLWITPSFAKILGSNVKTDTLSIWTSFLEYLFGNRDPRRMQPLVDYVLTSFKACNFNGELSLSSVKVAAFLRAFYEELGWRSNAWMDEILDRYWTELNSDHDEVRAYIADALQFSGKVTWQPNPSIPKPEVFVRECRVLPLDYDIMGMRGTYHRERVEELVKSFPIWRESRFQGARAFQSMYDRVGVMVCKWLFQSMHDIQASSGFDYILPLMPELFRFSEVNDNDDLSKRSSALLVRMCGVVPPRQDINPIIDAIFAAITSSSSWRVRLKALPLLQIFYFRQVPLISEGKVLEILEVICRCLDDEIIEVREMAATTLSGILRLSPRHSVITLKDRFVRLVEKSKLPPRSSPDYSTALRKLHAAILGICAIVDSYPYTVEKWMPSLLTDVLAEHTYDPIPVSSTVRKCASNFKKTHQDTWHEDSNRFTEDQLSALSTLLTGSSYYA